LIDKKVYSIVNVNKANVHSSPSIRSRIVATAERSEVLRTLKHKNDQVKIERHSGTKEWISQRLLWGTGNYPLL
jgi:SH3-like domain-containing protein